MSEKLTCFHCEAPIEKDEGFVRTSAGPLCLACEPEFEIEDAES
jgi:hypothetical protein